MKKKTTYQEEKASKSIAGRVRLVNEDQTKVLTNAVGDTLLLVADGLGGHNRGDYASKIAVDLISDEFTKRKKGFVSIFVAKLWLQYIFNKANKFVYDTGEKTPSYKGMGTTLVAVLVRKNNIVVTNVGDSRAYIYKDAKLERLSEDQSYVDYLKRSGQINEEEANKREDKNVLLSALGVYPSVSFNSRLLRYNGEPLLLCSDGLFNELKETEMVEILKQKLSAELAVTTLVNKANDNGGRDNISVVYYRRINHD